MRRSEEGGSKTRPYNAIDTESQRWRFEVGALV